MATREQLYIGQRLFFRGFPSRRPGYGTIVGFTDTNVGTKTSHFVKYEDAIFQFDGEEYTGKLDIRNIGISEIKGLYIDASLIQGPEENYYSKDYIDHLDMLKRMNSVVKKKSK